MQTSSGDARRVDAFLALLLATDLLFIIAHVIFMVMHLVVWDTPGLLDEIQSDFSIVKERGFAETFQYIKAFWLVLMFVWLAVKGREPGFLAWALGFLYLGVDDLMEIHEEFGNSLALRYGFPEILGQRPRDVGEVTVLAIAGLILLALVGIAYLMGSERFRQASRSLLGLVAVFAVFGMGFDALHIVFLHRSPGALFGLIEDGGELIVLSLIVWFVWRLATTPQALDDQPGELAPVAVPARHRRQRARR